MEFWELLEVSTFWSLPWFHLGLTGSSSLQHPLVLSWIGHFCGYALSPVCNSNKFSATVTSLTFFLLTNFTVVLQRKLWKKMNKTIYTILRRFYYFFPLFYTNYQFIPIVKHLQKYFVLLFHMCSFMLKLLKKQKTNIQRPIV